LLAWPASAAFAASDERSNAANRPIGSTEAGLESHPKQQKEIDALRREIRGR
jgi:hypothetical protein